MATPLRTQVKVATQNKLGFNVEAVAIAIALATAALIQINVISHIGW